MILKSYQYLLLQEVMAFLMKGIISCSLEKVPTGGFIMKPPENMISSGTIIPTQHFISSLQVQPREKESIVAGEPSQPASYYSSESDAYSFMNRRMKTLSNQEENGFSKFRYHRNCHQSGFYRSY